MIDLIGNGRPAADLLSRVVRVRLAGSEHSLPVLTIRGNREWRAQLDMKLGGLLAALEADGADLPAIFAALNGQVDDLLDLLISYDATGVLPDKATLEDTIYEDELLRAVQEVWRAANPLVAMTVATVMGAATEAARELVSSPPTSSPPPSGVVSRTRSTRRSRTSSSSRSSTPPGNGAASAPRPASSPT